MADTVHVPGVGPTKKKWVIVGGAATVLIVGVAYMRYRNTSAAAAAVNATTPATGAYSSGSQDQYPADGTTGNPSDPYSTDPQTGITYGDEGNQGGFYTEGYGPSMSGQTPYAADSSYGGYYYGNTNPTTNTTISTNEEWLTQAENDLQGVGYDQATAAAALSKVLAGLPVTAAQKDIFEQALGIDSNPPQGYKLPIRLINTPATPPPKPTTTTKGPIPNVHGETAAAAHIHLVARGFKSGGGVAGNLIIDHTVPPAGTVANHGSTVTMVPLPKKPAPKKK